MVYVRYVVAFVWALIVFVATVMLLGVMIGQMFDSIKGAWGIVPLVGQLAVAFVAGMWAFKGAMAKK